MKSEHYKKVEEFMQLAKQDTPTEPVLPDEKTRLLRAKLIFEEAKETIEELGFDLDCIEHAPMGTIPTKSWQFIPNGKENLVGIIDGCCDVKVVTTGTLVACGLPDIPFQEEVDQNNLDKFGPGHSFREDGKLIKPPDHQPPRLQKVLDWVIAVIKRNLPKSKYDYTRPIAKTGEEQFAVILRNRSGIDAGCVDMAVRYVNHLSDIEQQEVVDTAYMIYETYCKDLDKRASKLNE